MVLSYFYRPTFIALCIMSTLVLGSCNGDDNPTPQIPIGELLQGDIAFRRGEGIASDIVLYNDGDGVYSHIGLVIKHNDSIKIIHSVPGEGTFDGVKIEPIEQFFSPNRAVNGEIMRIDLTDDRRELLGKMALEKGNEYIKFDHDYNLYDTTRVYCTELIVLLFNHIGIDIADGRLTSVNIPGMTGDYIMPSDIYKNNKLTSIYKY